MQAKVKKTPAGVTVWADSAFSSGKTALGNSPEASRSGVTGSSMTRGKVMAQMARLSLYTKTDYKPSSR